MLELFTVGSHSLVLPEMQAVGELPEKLLYSRRDAAHALSISVRSLDYPVANKQLATRRLGGRVLIAASELARFAKADHYELTSVS